MVVSSKKREKWIGLGRNGWTEGRRERLFRAGDSEEGRKDGQKMDDQTKSDLELLRGREGGRDGTGWTERRRKKGRRV